MYLIFTFREFKSIHKGKTAILHLCFGTEKNRRLGSKKARYIRAFRRRHLFCLHIMSRQARYEPAYTISGFEKLRFSIAKRVSPIEIPFCNKKSARRESNPRPPPWQGGAPPLSHSRIVLCKLSVALTRTSSILLHVPGNVNRFFKFFYIFLLILFFCVPLFALRLNAFLSALTVFTIATVNAAVCTVSTRT